MQTLRFALEAFFLQLLKLFVHRHPVDERLRQRLHDRGRADSWSGNRLCAGWEATTQFPTSSHKAGTDG
jgi:hypothetical protein